MEQDTKQAASVVLERPSAAITGYSVFDRIVLGNIVHEAIQRSTCSYIVARRPWA